MSGWRKCINPTSHNSVSVKSSVCRFRGRARSFKTFSFKVAGFRARLLCKRIGFRLFLSSKVPILRFSFQLGGLWRSLRVFFFFFFSVPQKPSAGCRPSAAVSFLSSLKWASEPFSCNKKRVWVLLLLTETQTQDGRHSVIIIIIIITVIWSLW